MALKFRKTISGAVMLTAALALAACSGTPVPTSTTTAEAPPAATSTTQAPPATTATEAPPASTEPGIDDGTTLSMWTRAPLERQANALVAAYNASHQNQVDLRIIPNDDMEGVVGAAVTSGGLPDLLAGDVVRLPYWVDNGMFTDLTSQLKALPFLDDLAVGHLDAGTTVDGTMHTVPFVIDISTMVWNKDLYSEAGLDPNKGPTTLAEFVAHSKAIADLNKPGVAGTFFGGNCGGCLVFTWFPYIWGAGGEVLSGDGRTSLMDSDNAKAVFAAYKELVNYPNAIGEGSKEETGATWTAPFAEGKIGVMPYPATSVFAAVESGINAGAAPIPGINGGFSTFLGGDAIGVSKDSKNVDQAWNFLAWMLSDDTQLEVVAKAGEVPARVSLLDNDYTKANPLALSMNAAVANGRTPVATYFAEAFNAPGSPWTVLFRNAVFTDADSVAADNQAITDALDQ